MRRGVGLFEANRALKAARTVEAAAQGPVTMWEPPLPAVVTGPVNMIGLDNIPGLLGAYQTRDIARTIPAFTRGLDLITGIAAGLPLVELDPTGQPVQPLGFTALESYEPGLPRVTTIRQTVEDLVCEGRAHWFIDSQLVGGYPRRVRRISPSDAQQNEDNTWNLYYRDGTKLINVSHVADARVITFQTGTPGALHAGATALQTCRDLELAVSNYARAPVPALALTSTGLDLEDDDALALLGAWEAARRARATAYLNSAVKIEQFGFNAAELQLIEARQHAAAEVARILNLDPVWVGANSSGQSLTYQNMQDQNQQLLEATIMPLLRVIEQRLSMLTPGRWFRFDTTAFLRANLGDRVTAFTTYIAAGVMTAEEARDLEPLIRKGDLPA